MNEIKIGTRVIKNSRYDVPLEKQGKIHTVLSEPWKIGGTAVVKISGEAAGYALDGLTPVEDSSAWVSVNDELPPHGVDVFLMFPHNMAVGFYNRGGFWCVNSGSGIYTDVGEHEAPPTHWRNIPADFTPYPVEGQKNE